MLYELLAGRSAFVRTSSAETIAAILTQDPQPLEPATDVPPDLQMIVDRCLSKQPGSRFQSARDLAFALRSLSASYLRRVEPVQRRTSLRFVVAAGLAALVVAAAIWLYRDAASKSPAIAPTEPATTASNLTIAVLPFETDESNAWASASSSPH